MTYLANLTSFLAVVRVDPPFNSLDELVDQDEYSFGVQGNTGFEILFRVGLFSFSVVFPSFQHDAINVSV